MGYARGPRDLQGIPRPVAERTAKGVTTPMQTDLKKLSSRKITSVELTIKQNLVPVTLDLALVKNKKDVIGSAGLNTIS
jgi:hypothetical protein